MNNNELFDKYTIKSGDTLYNICKKNNINPDLFALINGLNINDYIYENQEVYIPKDNYSYYYTKTGDSLENVLNLFNIDYEKFTKINSNIFLEEGQLFSYKR